MSRPPPSLASGFAGGVGRAEAAAPAAPAASRRRSPIPIASRAAPIASATWRAFGSIFALPSIAPILTHLAPIFIMEGVAEGDTILRLARRFEATLLGRDGRRRAPRTRAGRRPGSSGSTGARLEGVESRGKHLLLDFGELSLHSHLGMSGGWHFYRRGARWRRPRASAWAVLSGERAGRRSSSAARPCSCRPTARLRRNPQLTRLGPDILAADFDPEAVVAGAARRPRPAASATPCSTSTWSPASATSSRARPASPPASIPGARSATSPTRSCARSSPPPASRC